jgi:hypothetical protein
LRNFIKGMILSTSFVLGLTAFTTNSYANTLVTTDNPESFYDSETGSVITAYKNTENGLVPVSEEEYKADTEAITEVEDPSQEYPQTLPGSKDGPQYEGYLTYGVIKKVLL